MGDQIHLVDSSGVQIQIGDQVYPPSKLQSQLPRFTWEPKSTQLVDLDSGIEVVFMPPPQCKLCFHPGYKRKQMVTSLEESISQKDQDNLF